MGVLLEEMQAVLRERAQHVAAIHKIDAYLAEVRMAMNTRQPTNSKRGRPDVSSERIVAALAIREPMSSNELRKATGIKKTTLEATLRKLADSGAIVRDPPTWNGPNGNYLYARPAEVVGSSGEPQTPDEAGR